MSRALPRNDRGSGQGRDILRGFFAGIALLAILVGMPAALALFIGWPLPRTMPSLGELGQVFSPDNSLGPAIDELAIVKVLAAITWLYWAHFVLCFMIELVAAIRGRVAGQVLFGGANQEVASRLVAAVLVLMPGQGALGAAATAAALPLHSGFDRAVSGPVVPGFGEQAGDDRATPFTTRSGWPGSNTTSTTTTPTQADADAAAARQRGERVGPSARSSLDRQGQIGKAARRGPVVREVNLVAKSQATRKVHMVVRGDTLWDIAGAHLPKKGARPGADGKVECDPFRWREIWELNRGRQQPGGHRLTDEDLIYPGDRLIMPADAIDVNEERVSRPAPEAPESNAPEQAPEQAPEEAPENGAGSGAGGGSENAPETTLGQGDEETPDEETPEGGLSPPATSPEEVPEGGASPPATSAPTTNAPRETTSTAPPTTIPTGETIAPFVPQPVDPDENGDRRPSDSTRPGPDADPVPPNDPARAIGQPEAETTRGPMSTVPWILGGGLLAAGVLALLAQRRRAQQRRRKAGQRLPLPTRTAADTELDMRATELPELAEFLDVSLRAMAAGINRDQMQVPEVLGVVAGPETLQVLLRAPAPGTPAPFQTTLSRRRWVLPLTTPIDELERLAGETSPPLPALVTIGVAEENHVLINLETLGFLGLTGDPGGARALLNALAVEFATSSWTDFVEVYAIGFARELDGLERVRVADSLDDVLPRLEQQAREVARVLEETGSPSMLAGRLGDTAPDSWVPAIVLCAEPPSAEAQQRLNALTEDPARSPIVAVAVALGDSDEVPGARWTVMVPASADELMRVAPLNIEVQPLQLDGANYDNIVELLRNAASLGPVPSADEAAPTQRPRPEKGSVTTMPPPSGGGRPDDDGGTPATLQGDVDDWGPEEDDDQTWMPAAAEWEPTERSKQVPRNASAAMQPEAYVATEARNGNGHMPSAASDPSRADGDDAAGRPAPAELPEWRPATHQEPVRAEVDPAVEEPRPTERREQLEPEVRVEFFDTPRRPDESGHGTAPAAEDLTAATTGPPAVEPRRAAETEQANGPVPAVGAAAPAEAAGAAGVSGTTPRAGAEPAPEASASTPTAEVPAATEVDQGEPPAAKPRGTAPVPAAARNGDLPHVSVGNGHREPVESTEEAPAVDVRVLGRVEVSGIGRIERGKSEELIVFLALHPEGVDADRVSDALWRGMPPAKATLNTTTTVARNSLGTTDEGELRLPHARNGVYRLHPSVGLDWARFEALATGAPAGTAGIQSLRQALELVRGRPFEGVRPRTYGWALLDLAAVMESAIVDVADHMADLCLGVGDASSAEWAARRGLAISPYDERLYRKLMLAADVAGNPGRIKAVMDQLLQRLDDDGLEPYDALHDETRELYERLLSRRQATPARRRA